MKKILLFLLLSYTSFAQSVVSTTVPVNTQMILQGKGTNFPTANLQYFKLANMAELRALSTTLIPNGAGVDVLGYYSAGDGGGGTYVLTNTVANTNVLGGRVLANGGIRSWELQTQGAVSVKQFGAKGDGTFASYVGTDDTASINAAFGYQQSSQAKTLFFPVGTYNYAGTMSNTTVVRVQGAGFSDRSPGTAMIQSFATNLPIFTVTGSYNIFENFSAGYLNYQPAANTSSRIFNVVSGTYNNTWRDLQLFDGAYAIYVPIGSLSWNSVISNVKINGYSISAVQLASGTPWDISQLYIQNIGKGGSLGGYVNSGAITGVVRSSGTNLTITCTSLPPLLTNNCFVTISGLAPSAYNGGFVVTAISGTDVSISLASDPGVDPSDVSGTLIFFPQLATGPALYLGDGFTGTISSLDIEYGMHSGFRVIEDRSSDLNVTDIWFEGIYGQSSSLSPYFHGGGNTFIGSISMANWGIRNGQAGYVVNKSGAGQITVGGASFRDVALNGRTLNFGLRNATNISNVKLLTKVAPLTTFRANAQSTLTAYGETDIPFSMDAQYANNLTGSSGSEDGFVYKKIIEQSGTAGFRGHVFDVDLWSTGSGTKIPFSVKYGGSEKLYVRSDGLLASSQGGNAIFLAPSSSAIQIFPTAASSSFFGPETLTTSSVRFDYFEAIDRKAIYTARSLQVYQNSNPANYFGYTINALGGDVTLGASTSSINIPGRIVGTEIADPAAPSANQGTLYFRDNGAGKTELVVRFNTGAIQVIATEP